MQSPPIQGFDYVHHIYVSRKLRLITIHLIVIKTEKYICQELWHLNKNEIANTMDSIKYKYFAAQF